MFVDKVCTFGPKDSAADSFLLTCSNLDSFSLLRLKPPTMIRWLQPILSVWRCHSCCVHGAPVGLFCCCIRIRSFNRYFCIFFNAEFTCVVRSVLKTNFFSRAFCLTNRLFLPFIFLGETNILFVLCETKLRNFRFVK